jgi:PAS domain S-box-containing protein
MTQPQSGGYPRTLIFPSRTVIVAALSERRQFGLALTCAAGGVACWLTATPLGLLAPIAVLYLHFEGRAVALLRAVLILACLLAFLAACLHAPSYREPPLFWAGFFVVALCIGEAVLAQAKLPADTMQATRIVKSMPAFTWSASRDGQTTYVSASVLSYIGQRADRPGLFHILGNSGWRGAIHPEDYPQVMEKRRRALATGEPFDVEYRVRRYDGVYRWFWTYGSLSREEDGQVAGWYGTMIDIEDKKQADARLRRSERQLQQLIDTVPALIWSTTADGTPSYVNKRFADVTGAVLADITAPDGSPSLSVIHPDDRPIAAKAVAHSFATGVPYVTRYRQLRRDGSYRWTETRAEALRDEAGRILQWYGVSVDIDDLVTAQQALRKSEQELQQLIDALPVHLWSWTPEGDLAYVSKRYLQYLGLSEAHFPDFTRVVAELIHPEDGPEVRRTAERCLKSGAAFTMRYRRRSIDGGYRWIEGRSEPLRDRDGTIVRWYHVSIDIDDAVRVQAELRLAQENLARQSQAASLSELSASIAHEVNQPLAAVVANSHACQRWLAADPPNLDRARKTVERIIRDANGAADVVSRIRALFKRSANTASRTMLGDVIGEVCGLMQDEVARRRARFEAQIEADAPPVAVDRIQIQQVFSNLIRNGLDAMDGAVGEKVIGLRVRRLDGSVQVEISDTGPGVEHPDRVFEPFYSTKESGMGMGLAICRSVVVSHGGRLWVEDNQPHGATFVFTLPSEAAETR